MTASLRTLEREAKRRGVMVVSDATCAKYGGTRLLWLRMLARQGWRCPVCTRVPKNGRFVTDHEHVRGWKNLPDDERWRYVRGITCWTCNRYLLARDISVDVARNVVKYLTAYERRRDA